MLDRQHCSQTSFGARAFSQAMISGGGGHRNQQWFVEAVRKSAMDLYEGAIMILESAIHNMEEAQARVAQAQEAALQARKELA